MEPKLPEHLRRLALVLALARVGSNMLARMPMMAITTNSSIRVNPLVFFFIILFFNGLRFLLR